MRKIPAIAAAGAALALLAVPSLASATSTAGDVYSATSSNVVFTVNGQNMTCSAADLGGHVQSGTNPAATVESGLSTWGGCTYSNQNVDVTFNASPWNLVADSGYTTAATDTAVLGHVGNVNAHLSTLGGACTFNVTGSAQATFNEVTQVLTVNETVAHAGLTVNTPSFGCFGVIPSGAHASFSGTFAVSATHPVNVF